MIHPCYTPEARAPESPWHQAWKGFVTPAQREVIIGTHRADLVNAHGWVVELQASPISPAEIRAREAAYGRMLWVIKAIDFLGNIDLRDKGDYVTFRWKKPRRSLWAMQAPMFWDLGGSILHVKKLHHDVPCGGWGDVLNTDEFISKYLTEGEACP